MHYSISRGVLNIILLVITLVAIVVLIAWLGYNAGVNVGEGRTRDTLPTSILQGIDVTLTTISLAENAGLHTASGAAKVDLEAGLAEIDIFLPEEIDLPPGTILAGWLVDAGTLGGLGTSSVSDADQAYGTPYANVDFSKQVDSAPYALSMGALNWNVLRESLHLFYQSVDSLAPYDAVMVTLESDANQGVYDPRPGTPILIGEIP
jgi:hypothetical protein